MVTLEIRAKHDHIQKIASTRDPVKALAEFVWNGVDADASSVEIEFARNALGGIDSIRIRDNGSGISKARANRDFENLGDSWKRRTPRTPVHARPVHGKAGQGRLRFFSLAHRAKWVSVYRDNDSLYQLTIEINADKLETSIVSDPVLAPHENSTGTVVELYPLKSGFDWLSGEQARSEFTATFAPYILQFPTVSIIYDGAKIEPNSTIERTYTFPTHPIICPDRTVNDLVLRVAIMHLT